MLDQSLLDTPLSSTPGGDGITFRQVRFAHVGACFGGNLFRIVLH